MEKVNPIIIKNEETGEEYTLEFTRKTVAYAEERGFSLDDVAEKMMVRIPELFHYAFRMHHPNLSKDFTDKILFEELGGINEQISERLVELYQQTYATLFNEDGESKNSRMKVIL